MTKGGAEIRRPPSMFEIYSASKHPTQHAHGQKQHEVMAGSAAKSDSVSAQRHSAHPLPHAPVTADSA